jgi:hypothetical protein
MAGPRAPLWTNHAADVLRLALRLSAGRANTAPRSVFAEGPYLGIEIDDAIEITEKIDI